MSTKKKKDKDNGTLPRPLVFYQNYDYVDNDPNGPGEGLYNGKMDKYKSVDDFRKKTKNRRQRLRGASIQSFLIKEAAALEEKLFDLLSKKDNGDSTMNIANLLQKIIDVQNMAEDFNDLNDPTGDTTRPIDTKPGDISPMGFLDGVWPVSDLHSSPQPNLYYGKLDGAAAKDGKNQ